jgi:pimeloyl-ACP methyl ester carboxylesterase
VGGDTGGVRVHGWSDCSAPRIGPRSHAHDYADAGCRRRPGVAAGNRLGPGRGAGVRRGKRVRLLIGEANRGNGLSRVGHNRVVMFDNSGVGRTQQLPASLTIDAMADQTSALIDTLGLGRPNVLGWSMGGMIAQALALLHPAQVRSGLILTRPMTARIGRSFPLCAPSTNACTWITFIPWSRSRAVVMRATMTHRRASEHR